MALGRGETCQKPRELTKALMTSVSCSRRTSVKPERVAVGNTYVSCAEGQRDSALVRSVPNCALCPVQFLNINYWSQTLPKIVNTDEAELIMCLITEGVRIGRPPASNVVVNPNWPSAREFAQQVGDIIDTDLHMGRLYGPFTDSPFVNYVISPLGAFLKRDSSKVRLIHDLSYPAVGSVNASIDPDDYSLQYTSVDDAVALCIKYKPKIPFLAKIYLMDAYKHIAVHPASARVSMVRPIFLF